MLFLAHKNDYADGKFKDSRYVIADNIKEVCTKYLDKVGSFPEVIEMIGEDVIL